MAGTVRMANMCGASLEDMCPKQRSLAEGKVWDDSDWWMDLWQDTEVGKNAYRVLCEANIAGATLPADVAAFTARHSLVHDAECEENIDDDRCFYYDDSVNLSVDEICELASLLRKWDIRNAFC